jgi:F0F1-type ATP synthase assembly protein I
MTDTKHQDDGNSNQSGWAQLGRVTQLAFILPVASVIGWLVGTGLDHWLHRTWIGILGLILGSFAGLFNLVQTVRKSDSEK